MTINYQVALNTLANNGNWAPIGKTIWRRSTDNNSLWIGSQPTLEGEIPTWEKKLVDTQKFNMIEDAVAGRGKAAGTFKADDIYSALDKSMHDVFNVYSSYYAPEIKRGKTFKQIGEGLKSRGLGAATLSGQTFATLRNTATQLRVIRFIERTPHFLLNATTRMTVDDLTPVKFGDFQGSDSISEKVGEFETPMTGLGKYTQHEFKIDKYIGGFNVAPEFFMYDYGQYDIIGDHLRDQVGEIDEIRNKRVYEIMVGTGVTTVAAAGSWSALTGQLNTNNPTKDIRPIVYTMNNLGKNQRAEYIVMNTNLLTTYETNTFIGPAQNPNDTGMTTFPTDVPMENGVIGSLRGLRGLTPIIDSMLSDADGVVIGSRAAIVFADGPSSSRSFVEQRSEVLMRQNKWWFGPYLFDATLIKRITGAA